MYLIVAVGLDDLKSRGSDPGSLQHQASEESTVRGRERERERERGGGGDGMRCGRKKVRRKSRVRG